MNEKQITIQTTDHTGHNQVTLGVTAAIARIAEIVREQGRWIFVNGKRFLPVKDSEGKYDVASNSNTSALLALFEASELPIVALTHPIIGG